jgi:hypothetical protein
VRDASRAEHVVLTVFDQTDTVVATGAPITPTPPDNGCMALDVALSPAGMYRLRMTTDASYAPVGDVFLEYR